MKYFGDAVILCGGKSKRMDFDKSFLKINGKYIIEIIYEELSPCFDHIRLSADAKERFGVFGLEVIEDKIQGYAGPAVGIYSALSQATSQYVFVVACDMPLINRGHVEFMKSILQSSSYLPDALVPMKGGYIEPLYSFYSAGIARTFAQEIDMGNYKIHEILRKCRTLYLEDKYSKSFAQNLDMFTNINCRADLERFL